MARVREQLVRLSARATLLVARRWGDALGMWVGAGFPKSGTVWLCQLVGGYLDIPHPRQYALPIAMESVIHTHGAYHPRLPRCVYLYRDGRDVMVSLYFFSMRLMDDPTHPRTAMIRRRRYERALGPGFDPDDVVANLPRFIELEMTDPLGTDVNWAGHIDQWYRPGRPNVAYLSYEGLLADPARAVRGGLEPFLGEPVDEARLRATIDRYDFALMSGRRRGDEDKGAFLRKGVAGDWRRCFSREAAEVFDHYAGATLVTLGYEPDHAWVRDCPG